MGDSTLVLAPNATEVSDRDIFSTVRLVFFILIHIGVLGALWFTTWQAVLLCVALHMLFGGVGICVGYHRLLTHRSFKTPKAIEYFLAFCGAMCMQGAPLEWVALHRKHHQHSDSEGDPHSAREGFWWSHAWWVLWTPSDAQWDSIRSRYAPDLMKVGFYRFLEKTHYLFSAALGVLLFFLGGWPFVVWGMFIRLVITYHATWLVNSASHSFGYQSFKVKDLSTNCWWVALLSNGEGWHNNHHAFPSSARHGLKWWEFDASYLLIRTMKLVGLARDIRLPSQEQMARAAIE
jgi:stearoyl-CoA desaturase (delta-9 desaturase)